MTDPLAQLTPRQRVVLAGLAQSKTVKEIAWELGLSPKTVEYHRHQLQDRLNIHDLAGLTRFALYCGLVPAHYPRRD